MTGNIVHDLGGKGNSQVSDKFASAPSKCFIACKYFLSNEKMEKYAH